MPEVERDEAAKGSRKRKPKELTPTLRALMLLVRREHSRKELAGKLAARGIDAADAHAAVERLTGDGWQSDARFAEMLVRTRVAQRYGPQRIRAELGVHGIDPADIDAAMDSFEGDWAQVARDVLERRFGGRLAGDRAQQRKAADFLYRRGFDGDLVRTVLREALGD